VIHNVRSALNVGSMLRTAEGLGVYKVYLTGYTPYPEDKNDERLPHLRKRTALQIHKTALGAEDFLDWEVISDINVCLGRLKNEGYYTAALEQTKNSMDLNEFTPAKNVALIVGNEVNGIEEPVLKQVDVALQIPMSGHKESFNVAVAAGIAMYKLKHA
jgi:23S rRNA (guanosine2251-2'-O)-methyltransferase